MAYEIHGAITFRELRQQTFRETNGAQFSFEDPKPVWDEEASLFWCPTPVNAYDIPDGLQWQEVFRQVVTQHEPDFFNSRPCLQEVTNLSSLPLARSQQHQHKAAKTPCYESPRASARIGSPSRAMASPVTPTKKHLCTPDSPMTPTPPLFRASSPKSRALRATHTKALMSMKQKAGVSAVVQGRELAFFRFGGEVFVVNARCPHQGGNLCEGEVGDIEDVHMDGKIDGRSVGSRRAYVTCPVHKMQFDLRDGSVIHGNCRPLKYYRIRIAEVDEKRKLAPIEVGFDSLADTYFGELLF